MGKSVVVTAVLAAVVLFGGAFSNCEASEPEKSGCPGGKLEPIDEGVQDKSFEAFRGKLMEAVRNYDVNFIEGVLDPKVVNSYPEKDVRQRIGKRNFLSLWEPDGECSKLWDTLSVILSMGGSFTDKSRQEFRAPYISSAWPSACDPSEYSAIIGKQINVRTQPDLSAPVLTQLSYRVVRVHRGSDNEEWQKITTPDGKEGYVFSRFIRSKYDYSIHFVKVNGKWMIKYLAERSKEKRRLPDPEGD